MKKSYQVLKWTAEVREKELQCLEEVELEVPPRKYDCYSRNVPNKYRYHYKGDLSECGLKIK